MIFSPENLYLLLERAEVSVRVIVSENYGRSKQRRL